MKTLSNEMKSSTILRELANRGQSGHSRTPRSFIMLESYTSYYWNHCSFEITFDTWKRVCKLSTRYRRFCRHIEEVSPQWKQHVKYIHYADNSTEEVQINKYGETRQIMVSAPSGDASF